MWCASSSSGSNAQPCSPYLSGMATVSSVSVDVNASSTLSFTPAAPANDEFVSDLTEGGARYVIQNNQFLHNRGRGAVLQTADGFVTGNTFTGQTMHSIYVTTSPFWGEGPGVQNVVVADNTISSVGNYSQNPAPFDSVVGAVVVATEDTSANTIASASPLHQNIIFSGNTITDTPGPGFFISTANNVVLANNQLTNTNQVSTPTVSYGSAKSTGSIVLTNVSNVLSTGNTLRGTSGAISVDSTSTSGITLP